MLNRQFTSLFTSSQRSGSVRSYLGLMAIVLMSMVSFAPRSASAQDIPPLSDMVPLDELETTTDDLIRLATSYADAIRELKTAKLTVDTLQALKPNAVLTGLEVRVAQVNVETSQSKVMVLRAIVEKQLVAAEAKAAILRKFEATAARDDAAASATKPYLLQAEATIAILKMILALK